MKYLRQSTATTIIVGPFVDKVDGITPKTALTDQSANGRLVKNGTGSAITAASWAHDAFGHYVVGLSTGHTDTIGKLRLEFSDPTTFVPVWEDYSVLSQAVYDSLFGPTALSKLGDPVPLAASQPLYAPALASTAPAWYSVTPSWYSAGGSDPWSVALPGSYGAGTAGAILGNKTGFKLASDGLDLVITEAGINHRQAMVLVLDACCSILSGAAGTTIAIKDPTGTTTRILATVDASGNRTAVTLTPPI